MQSIAFTVSEWMVCVTVHIVCTPLFSESIDLQTYKESLCRHNGYTASVGFCDNRPLSVRCVCESVQALVKIQDAMWAVAYLHHAISLANYSKRRL